jgi:hypothetical protein
VEKRRGSGKRVALGHVGTLSDLGEDTDPHVIDEGGSAGRITCLFERLRDLPSNEFGSVLPALASLQDQVETAAVSP